MIRDNQNGINFFEIPFITTQGNSSNRQEMDSYFFQQNLGQKCGFVFVLTQENTSFKDNRKTLGSSKNATRNF